MSLKEILRFGIENSNPDEKFKYTEKDLQFVCNAFDKIVQNSKQSANQTKIILKNIRDSLRNDKYDHDVVISDANQLIDLLDVDPELPRSVYPNFVEYILEILSLSNRNHELADVMLRLCSSILAHNEELQNIFYKSSALVVFMEHFDKCTGVAAFCNLLRGVSYIENDFVNNKDGVKQINSILNIFSRENMIENKNKIMKLLNLLDYLFITFPDCKHQDMSILTALNLLLTFHEIEFLIDILIKYNQSFPGSYTRLISIKELNEKLHMCEDEDEKANIQKSLKTEIDTLKEYVNLIKCPH